MAIIAAYHTKTPDQYRHLMSKLEQKNYKWWGSWSKPSERFNWYWFKENTCIMLDDESVLTYCDIQFVNECIEAESEYDGKGDEVLIKSVRLPKQKKKWKWRHLR